MDNNARTAMSKNGLCKTFLQVKGKHLDQESTPRVSTQPVHWALGHWALGHHMGCDISSPCLFSYLGAVGQAVDEHIDGAQVGFDLGGALADGEAAGGCVALVGGDL